MANYDSSIRVHTDVNNEELKATQKEIDTLTRKLENLRQKAAKLEILGGTEKQFESIGYDCEMIEDKLAGAYAKLEQLQSVDNVSSGFDRAKASAKKLFNTLLSGQKKSNTEFKNMNKMMVRMLAQMLLFQAVSKTLEFVGAGMQNLAQYSDELNGVLSDMKSESATLKNSLATAFEPIITTAVPYITQLISWLNIATSYIAQFWAVLGGRNTYTKAKKQVVDYAKSLKDASDSAKGALAAFDDLNVLDKKEGNGNVAAGGEVAGADTFEEVEIDRSKFGWVEWLRDNLDMVLDLVGAIGLGFLAWKLAAGFTDSLSLLFGIALAVGGAFLLVKNAVSAWQNGIDWGNLTGMLVGAIALITGLGIAFGSVGAAIGAFIAGATLVVVGIKDMIENGVNLKNSIAVIAGTFLTVASVAGGAIGTIAAAVVALVLAIIKDWKNFKKSVIDPVWDWMEALIANVQETVDGVKLAFDGILKFFKGVFTGDWKLACEGIKDAFKGSFMAISGIAKFVMNTVAGIINTIINGIVGAINAVIRAVNSIDFTVPDWVPVIGGKAMGFNIPTIDNPYNIPYLATGGIVTAPIVAGIGEAGREAVLPLESNTGWMDDLADKIASRIPAGGPGVAYLQIDGKTFARLEMPYLQQENNRIGVSFKVSQGGLT